MRVEPIARIKRVFNPCSHYWLTCAPRSVGKDICGWCGAERTNLAYSADHASSSPKTAYAVKKIQEDMIADGRNPFPKRRKGSQ